MGQCDRLEAMLPLGGRSPVSSRSPSPQPGTPTPDQTVSVAQPSANLDPAVENIALRAVFEKHIERLSDEDKHAFLQASASGNAGDFALSVKELEDQHGRYSHPLSNFIGVLDRFMNSISEVVQTNPDISSLVLGGVRIVVDTAIGFLPVSLGTAIGMISASYFDTLSGMLCRFGEFLDTLMKYADVSRSFIAALEPLANVYGDLLSFCSRSRNFFLCSDEIKMQSLSREVISKFQWDLDDRFWRMEVDLRHHLDVLQQAAGPPTLDEVLSLEQSENETREEKFAKKKEMFLRWISSATYEKKHQEIYNKKHPGTSEWLIEELGFQDWLKCSSSAILWCHGKAGAGKSVLASNVVETVKAKFATRKEIGICFTYCDYKQEMSQVFSETLLALTQQLCRKGDVPSNFTEAMQSASPPSTIATRHHFTELARDFDEVFVLIDALDEYQKEQKLEILGFLKDVLSDLPCVKIFITSRREQDTVEFFEGLGAPVTQVAAKTIDGDVKKYVSSEVTRLRLRGGGRKLLVKDDALAQRVVDTLTKKADGSFLWVNLQLATLCDASEMGNDIYVEQALDTLPSNLDETYLRMVDQIEKQQKEKKMLALRCLMWVFYAIRPLTLRELRYAVIFGNPVLELPSAKDILDVCANFLDESRPSSPFESIVRPIHYSVREFFATPGKFAHSSFGWAMLSKTHEIHRYLCNYCLECLGQTLQAEPCGAWLDLRRLFDRCHFVWYAAKHFDSHAVHLYRSTEDPSDPLLRQMYSFLEKSPLESALQVRNVKPSRRRVGNVETWARDSTSPNYSGPFFRPRTGQGIRATLFYSSLLYEIPFFEPLWKRIKPPVGALHIASTLGLVDAVERLLDNDVDVNSRNPEDGMTALCCAVRENHLEVVRVLISNNADVNMPGGGESSLETPLQIASRRRRSKHVRLLLEHGAHVNANALQSAAGVGAIDVVELLLDHGADINANEGHSGGALLAAACLNSQGPLLGLLLERGADANAHGGQHGSSALQTAAYLGHEHDVKTLLRYGADVNAVPGKFGGALQAAVIHRQHVRKSEKEIQRLVATLLKHDADVNAGGGEYGCALRAAEAQGCKSVVSMLLAHGAKRSEDLS